MRISVASKNQDIIDRVSEAGNIFFVFQFGINEVERRNKAP
jgi:hypothetical protein